jgi:hypothetical protein
MAYITRPALLFLAEARLVLMVPGPLLEEGSQESSDDGGKDKSDDDRKDFAHHISLQAEP